MIVDVHGHISPPEALKRYPMPPSLGDVEGMIERKLEAGIGLTIVGSPVGAGAMVPVPGVDNYAQPADRLARAARLARRDRASVTPSTCGPTCTSTRSATTPSSRRRRGRSKHDAFVGLIANTSVRGEYLDSERAAPFFALAEEADVPVLLHPPAAPAAGQGLRGLPTARAGRALQRCHHRARVRHLRGWLDRHPGLRLIGAQGGGAIALMGEKLDQAYAAPHWPHGRRSPPPPSSYLRRIWVDTASPSMVALQRERASPSAPTGSCSARTPRRSRCRRTSTGSAGSSAGTRSPRTRIELFGLKERVA